jgi:hypothetical protein
MRLGHEEIPPQLNGPRSCLTITNNGLWENRSLTLTGHEGKEHNKEGEGEGLSSARKDIVVNEFRDL